jgi:hypothetical protein
MTERPASRLFLDSNVLIRGIISSWSFDHALLKLCAARIHLLVLADVVRLEVEHILLSLAKRASSLSDLILSDYDGFLRRAEPEIVPPPNLREVTAARHLIRHQADVPVLLSAIKSRPDWMITNNTKHFTPEVANRSGLRIADPESFFRFVHKGGT